MTEEQERFSKWKKEYETRLHHKLHDRFACILDYDELVEFVESNLSDLTTLSRNYQVALVKTLHKVLRDYGFKAQRQAEKSEYSIWTSDFVDKYNLETIIERLSNGNIVADILFGWRLDDIDIFDGEH